MRVLIEDYHICEDTEVQFLAFFVLLLYPNGTTPLYFLNFAEIYWILNIFSKNHCIEDLNIINYAYL